MPDIKIIEVTSNQHKISICVDNIIAYCPGQSSTDLTTQVYLAGGTSYSVDLTYNEFQKLLEKAYPTFIKNGFVLGMVNEVPHYISLQHIVYYAPTNKNNDSQTFVRLSTNQDFVLAIPYTEFTVQIQVLIDVNSCPIFSK